MSNLVDPLNLFTHYRGLEHQKAAMRWLFDQIPETIHEEFTRRWRTPTQNPMVQKILAVVPSDRIAAARVAVPLLIDACVEFGVMAPAEVAYVMATVSHECLFRPIKEIRANPDRNPEVWKLQQRYWGSGYYGRGYVQLTWRENYIKMGRRLGINLLDHPDLALVPEHAARICVCGMAEGLFTGRRLAQFYRPDRSYDFVQARRIVNGLDRAELIASYAEVYLGGLTDS